MQIPVEEISRQTFDLCVVGSGPAGLTLAMEAAKLRSDWKVLVLEYGFGPDGPNDLDDTIVNLNKANHHDPYECTNKGFGGTSRTWGGRCVTYDEIDFIPRDVIGDTCTWNVAIFEDVKRYYARAGEYLDCGRPVFDIHQVPGYENRPIADNFVEGDFVDSALERWSLPTRYEKRYTEKVAGLTNLFFAEGCKVESVSKMDGDRVVELEVLDRKAGGKHAVSAHRFVIAAGAQESTRILLKSPKVFGPGGVPDSLGKYYQGHISGKIASIKFNGKPKDTDFGIQMDSDGTYIRRRFQMTTETMQREGLLNTALWLDNPLYWDPKHRNGTMSLIYLMMLLPVIGKKLAPAAIADSVTKGKAYGIGGHIRNIVLGLPGSVLGPLKIFKGRYMAERKLPGVFLYNSRNEYALHYHGEQIPSVDHYMKLAGDGKSLEIQYGYKDIDVDSVLRTHQLLDQQLRKTGSGELSYWYPESELRDIVRKQSTDGIHQVGTTRISLEPKDGVLDTDMRVWNSPNLYVCSSSAFPTSGQANPTFLLVAFAVRLAEHLSKQ